MTEENVTPIDSVVDFDVETEERAVQERLAQLPPYRVRASGKTVEMLNARLIDWQTVVGIGNDPVEFLAYVVPDEDGQRAIIDAKMSSETMRQLMSRYFDHYGMNRDDLVMGSQTTVEHLNRANRRKRNRRR